jgi:preprotein translocase subunit SecE
MATQTRGQGAERRSGSGAAAKRDRTTPALFTRQVAAELRKVIWPTRNELVTYTVAALVFVVIMSTIVLTLDYGFTKLMFYVFG